MQGVWLVKSVRFRLRCFFPGVLFAASIFPFANVWATPFEAGFQYTFSYRSEDRFDEGMRKFRSSLSPTTYNVVQADRFSTLTAASFFFRFTDVIAEHGAFGFEYGLMTSPEMRVNELRSDGGVFLTHWKFRLPYFMFTYHWIAPVPGLGRNMRYELGFGYGFVAGGSFIMDGVYRTNFQVGPYDSFARARQGSVIRLEGALRRNIGEFFFARFGLRAGYAYIGDFETKVAGAAGGWYYLRNNGLSPVGSAYVATANTVVYDPLVGPVQVSAVREKAIWTGGLWEMAFSFGFRL